MHRLRALCPLRDQRGIALPMAMMILMILSVLIAAFSMLAASEPVLATNQLQVAQTRAVAESGLERAMWALNNPANPNGIPNPLVTSAAPYDGSTAIPVLVNGVQIGTFTVSVTNGATSNERNIVATAWGMTGSGSVLKAKQKIVATVYQVRFLDPPAALVVRGEINAGGNSDVDSRSDTSCGNKAGSWSKGVTTIGGSATIYGHDGDNVANQGGDAVQNVANSAFDPYTYSNAELSALKAIAKAQGTYYQGAVSFSSSNRIPNGVIYVDTVSGQNIDINGTNTTATSDLASVSIHGGAPADSSGIFSGWLIVAGSLSISGNFQMQGMIYVQNDLTYTGTGTGQIDGAIISQNIRDVSATIIDTNTGGNAAIIYNCNYAKHGGGQVPQTWTIESGTYKEISG
jgi:Tfp pilus assembly protein PilX